MIKVVVSGDIGVGKSTVVRAAMERLEWREPAGFFTHWGGKERGAPTLYLETWGGDVQPIAQRTAEPAEAGRLPYQLDLPVFTGAALASLISAEGRRPVVIDELGLIERGAREFAEAVAKLFRGAGPVLAVVQQRAIEHWRPLIEPGNIIQWVNVSLANRDGLPEQVAARFRTGTD